jgi:hypothetical protein
MTSRIPVSAVFALLVAAAAPAQFCLFGDDGFDTGCCAAPAPNLPAFPPQSLMANYGIFEGCGATFSSPTSVQLGAPQFVTCDLALINVSAQFGTQTINGLLVAKYVRTWMDVNPVIFGQVWRFLVNGDLICQSNPPATICSTLLPRCSALMPPVPVHWDGHVDYVCDPLATSGFRTVISLHHMQGCITHAPWSCVVVGSPADHVEASYHLVGPLPFTFGTGGAEPQGALVADSVRSAYVRLIPQFQYQCASETKIPNIAGAGFLTTQQDGGPLCASFNSCTNNPIFTAAPGCYQHQQLNAVDCCNGTFAAFQSLPIPGTPVATTGLVAFKVGTFGASGFNAYPSGGNLTIYFGVVAYPDQCGLANFPFHAVVGVGMSNVFGQLFNTSAPLPCGPPNLFPASFIDLQNVLPLNNLPFLFPGYGCLAVPDVVWSLGT